MAVIQTATLAEIFAQQGHWDRAVSIYRRLLEDAPDRQDWRNRLAQLEGHADHAASIAAIQGRIMSLKVLLKRIRARRVNP